MARLSRADRTHANREAILTAARAHFAEHGYHGASVDAIAEAAGFSKGAIYSQFGSKDDLMLAVLERNIEQRHTAMMSLVESLGPDLRFADVVGEAHARTMSDRGWQSTLVEFRVHASRHPEVNARYQAIHERTIDRVTAVMARLADHFELHGELEADALTPRDLAIAFLAAGVGHLVETLAVGYLDVLPYLRSVAVIVQASTTAPEGATR